MTRTQVPIRPAALLLLPLLFLACGDPPEEGPVRYDRDGRLVGDAPRPERLPNLVLILIDTLRADVVALPGLSGGSMPFLTELAAGGVAFSEVTAPAPWTVPSITSLLTGLLPGEHGCDAPREAPRLVDAVTTFAEALRAGYGYETAAFVAGPWFGGSGGVLQGFAHVESGFGLQGTAMRVAEWSARRDASKPFFLLLHTFEAHDPYGAEDHPWPETMTPPERIGSEPLPALASHEIALRFLTSRPDRIWLTQGMGPRFMDEVVRYLHTGYRDDPRPEVATAAREAYLEGVRWVDGLLKSSVEYLRGAGLLEDALLAVTSDHGEAFGEHGTLEHGRILHDEVLRVPLVLSGPAPFAGGRVIRGSVGLTDLLPTFFDFAGLVPLAGTDGRSFLPLVRTPGDGADAGRPVRSEERLDRRNTGADDDATLLSVRSSRWKYIVTWDRRRGTVTEEAYDLSTDPEERRDLAGATQRIDGLPFDPDFCRAVEATRDLLWVGVESVNRRADTPYGGGAARVTGARPRPCGP